MLSQIEELGLEMFDDIVKKDELPLSVDSQYDSFPDYLESWRILLWDKAFLGSFKGQSEGFKKGDDFRKRKGSDLVVKRSIFRYDSSCP